MPKSSTSFNEENQPIGRKPRGKSERTKILDAMARGTRTEEEFYDLLITRAFNPEDQFGFGELLRRISPIPKQVSPSIEFDFDKDAKVHVQASQVLDAISSGLIPADIGGVFIQSIKAMIEIEEGTDLKERIIEIEKKLGLTNG